MTERAKRLAYFLEENYGWFISENRARCPECGETVYDDYNFCRCCGRKVNKKWFAKERKEAYRQIENAIEYALEEDI